MVFLDPNLIREYTFEAQSKQPKGVHVAKFSHDGKQLNYIAASHTQTERNFNGEVVSHTKNPTLGLIDKQIAQYKPDFIVFETPDRFNLSNLPHDLEKMRESNYVDTLIGESQYGTYVAHQHNIPFQGGEPEDSKVVNDMLELGYQRHDVAYFYAFRSIPEVTKNGQKPVDEIVLKHHINQYLQHYSKDLGVSESEKLDYEGMKQWFNYHNKNASLTLATAQTNDAAPLRNKQSSFFMNMSADIGDIREKNVNRVIQDAMNKHDRVMVVYGGGHLVKSLPVYEAAMGSPSYEMAGKGEILRPEPPKKETYIINSNSLFLTSAILGVAALMTPFTAPFAVAALGGGAVGIYQKKQELLNQEKPIDNTIGSNRNIATNKGVDKQAKYQQPSVPSKINYRDDFADRYLAETKGNVVGKGY